MIRISPIAAAVTLFAIAVGGTAPLARAAEATSQKLAELRARFAADPRVKQAREAVEAAEKAIADKLANDPIIAAARRAEQSAREAVGKAEQSAADADPQVQEHRLALAAARTRDVEFDLQRRFEEMKAEQLRNEARAKPELRELWGKAQFHPHNQESLKADPRLAAARKKLDEANASLDRKLKELPEHKASEQAKKEFDEAVAASQGMKDAEAARRAIEDRVAADDRVSAQVGRVKAAADVQAAHRKTIAEIEQRIREASTQAAAKDARVAEAMSAVAAAQGHVAKTTQEQLSDVQKARDAARNSWQQKFDAVIAESPEADDLAKEMRSLEERLQVLRQQMGELRRPAAP
jgi:hypothetical protein